MTGEIIDGNFLYGVSKKPSFNSEVKLLSKEEVLPIISVKNYTEYRDLYIGKSSLYDGVKIYTNMNDFFSNHFAIFGSTGSGKSCGISRIIQNIFDKNDVLAYKASIFIFDAYGEYKPAFVELNKKMPQISMKSYTTNLGINDSEIIKIPLWLLSVDDIALLLDASSHNQIPIIEKALKLVNIFARDESEVIKHKNDIIARAILDILSSGGLSSQIRDQIFSILSHYNTSNLNLETPVVLPGYTRPLKQCLLIDASGKIRDMELLTNFFESFLDETLEMQLPDGTFAYSLDDLKDAFDFALISEGVLKSEKIYDEANILRVRLHSLANGDYRPYFDYSNYITKEEYIKELITSPSGLKAQIINFNINYVDDRFAKVLTKIYSKLLFDYAKEQEARATQPFHIILEEAHRYVQNDNDVFLLGYNIFERIAKEGRKYGVLLGLISQRPSELSETCLSQCGNFLIFKMLHPRDVKYIEQMIPNITVEIIQKLKVLQPGACVAFGLAFKVPILVKLDMPSPAPSSNSVDITRTWFVRKK